MTYHVLNGDCLANDLVSAEIKGNTITCRECLIEGPLNVGTLAQFWKARAQFIASTYDSSIEDYFDKVVTELEKLLCLPANAKVYLWFEDDLFCQANLWFTLSLLKQVKVPLLIYRVFPMITDPKDTWKGFGMSDRRMLEQSFNNSILFSADDLRFGFDLWNAYKEGDFEALHRLSFINSPCFQHLEEVCQAHIDRFPANGKLGRPEKCIQEIMDTSNQEFNQLFNEFSQREGIYGLGDVQVKRIYNEQLGQNS